MKCLVHPSGLIQLPVLLRSDLANKIHCFDTFPSSRQSQPRLSVSLTKYVRSQESSGALLGAGPLSSKVGRSYILTGTLPCHSHPLFHKYTHSTRCPTKLCSIFFFPGSSSSYLACGVSSVPFLLKKVNLFGESMQIKVWETKPLIYFR